MLAAPRTGVCLAAFYAAPVGNLVALRAFTLFAAETDGQQVFQASIIVGKLLAEVFNGVFHISQTLPNGLLAVKGYK